MNELNNINQKENYIKINITNYLEDFSNQLLDMINQTEILFQNMNNNNLISNNNISNNFIVKNEYFDLTKEIPILSKVQNI